MEVPRPKTIITFNRGVDGELPVQTRNYITPNAGWGGLPASGPRGAILEATRVGLSVTGGCGRVAVVAVRCVVLLSAVFQPPGWR